MSQPQDAREAIDISAITQLILKERLSRDLGLWDDMRDCFHPDFANSRELVSRQRRGFRAGID